MSLTPKNWQTFQHYKDRSPVWIKLHRGLLDDYEFNCLPLASRALAPMLWLIASEYENGKITASLEALAFRLRITRTDLVDALNPLIESGFFTCDSETLAPCEQEATPERENKKQVKTEKEENSRAKRPSASDDFERIWRRYPKRAGGNPRKPALRAFEAAIAAGVSVQAIEAGLERDLGVWTAEKAIGTRFIPQTVTWFQQARWDDHADLQPSQTGTIGVPLMPGTDQFKAWFAAVPRKSLAYSLMTRADDTRQPYYAPSEWPPDCQREQTNRDTEAA